MADERRSSRRVHLSGVRVTYESATGERVEADAIDLSSGGLFVRTAAPFPVGKRIALDIQVIGEQGPWAALGRVVWVRERGEGDGAPPGMGVKIIDADDTVLQAIERLVETREHTEPGVGSSQPPPPMAPILAVGNAPEREATLMGVGAAEGQQGPAPGALPREQSVAIDLVAKKVSERPPAPAAARGAAAAAPKEGGGAGRWVVILALLVVAGIAAYVLLDGFLTPPATH